MRPARRHWASSLASTQWLEFSLASKCEPFFPLRLDCTGLEELFGFQPTDRAFFTTDTITTRDMELTFIFQFRRVGTLSCLPNSRIAIDYCITYDTLFASMANYIQ